ncbi:MAG TPA: ribose-5-phosphate isomerase RpiA [Rhizomicrobium sp.]|jgi:ribose 5-phosphate isomerase A|nr:ribose-5-phosphate isomerase RpiA [Rhizomicrobium sp.]
MSGSDSAILKRAAATRALDFVENGMKLGLGTGSTAEAFLEVLAPRVRGGLTVTGAATSERTAIKARGLGIPIALLEQLAPLDLTIDGADEADRSLTLIKGGGGALLREKLVASASKRMVVVADGSKLVQKLGRFPLPVEVVEFGHTITAMRIAQAAAELGYSGPRIVLRMQESVPVRTDGGNLIYDCALGSIGNAVKVATMLKSITGVVEHGLFVGLATTLVIAHAADKIEILERKTDA